MPNRIIRESARTSATLYRLSHGAERMFWRLTTVADDYGRFEADPRILRAACFPLWGDRLKVATVAAWYDEMRAAELVRAYQDNGKTYGVFTTWERHQRARARHSKYPPPPSADICGHMRTQDVIGGQPSGGHVLSNVPEESRNRGVEESRNRGRTPPSPPGFDRFWSAYPKRVGKDDAARTWAKRECEPLAEAIVVALERQRSWLMRADERGGKKPGDLCPNPATWLNQGRWKDEPPTAGAPAAPQYRPNHTPTCDCPRCTAWRAANPGLGQSAQPAEAGT